MHPLWDKYISGLATVFKPWPPREPPGSKKAETLAAFPPPPEEDIEISEDELEEVMDVDEEELEVA